MKIYINDQHQIKGLRKRPESDFENLLKEIEVEDDFLSEFCDTVKMGFCYESTDNVLAIYPYKDFDLLMSIQEMYEEKEKQVTELQLALTQVFEVAVSANISTMKGEDDTWM